MSSSKSRSADVSDIARCWLELERIANETDPGEGWGLCVGWCDWQSELMEIRREMNGIRRVSTKQSVHGAELRL